MYEKLERLYDEIYGPKLTPYELLDNVKLPHYISVDFKKENNFIQGITKCYIETGELAVFIYTFNQDNKLISLKSIINNIEEEIYNRELAIQQLYSKTIKDIKPQTNAS